MFRFLLCGLPTVPASSRTSIATYRVKQYRDLGHEVNDAVEHDLALFIMNILN